MHRSDDTEEAMVKRIEQYKKNVDAIKGYYKVCTRPVSLFRSLLAKGHHSRV